MKTLARIGAGLSFTAFFLAGATILSATRFKLSGESVLLTALGLFLVGTAFFAGLMLWLVAEKWTVTPQGPASDAPSRGWPWKIILLVFSAVVGVMAVLPLLRFLASAVVSQTAIVP